MLSKKTVSYHMSRLATVATLEVKYLMYAKEYLRYVNTLLSSLALEENEGSKINIH